MMNLNKPMLTVALALFAATLVGCKKKEAPQQPSPAPSMTSAPQVDTSRALRPEDLNLAQGAQFPAELVPADESAARGVARLASAFAAGDADALRSLLDRSDAAVLDHLIATGDWESSTAATTVVRVCAVAASDGAVRVALGFEDADGAYLLGFEGRQERGAWRFTALPIGSSNAARAADLDAVAGAQLAG